jgi:hypothetical protein
MLSRIDRSTVGTFIFLVCFLLISAYIICYAGFHKDPSSVPSDIHSTEDVFGRISNIEQPFVRNEGQLHEKVNFHSFMSSGEVYVTDESIVYTSQEMTDPSTFPESIRDRRLREQEQNEEPSTSQAVLLEEFIDTEGEKITLEPVPGERSETVMNFFKGQDPENWKREVPTFESVILENVWDGIDIKLSGTSNQLEHWFAVHPGSDPSVITVSLDPADSLTIDEDGSLSVKISDSLTVSLSSPIAFQEIDGETIMIDISYILSGNTYSFEIADYDDGHTLHIDPILESPDKATYIGGASEQFPHEIDADSEGNIFMVATSLGGNFPIVPGAYQETWAAGSSDYVIVKFDPDMTELLSSTFLGGTSTEYFPSLAIDNNDAVYIAGESRSSNFPVIPGSFQDTSDDGYDGVIAKLSNDLTELLAGTYLHGSTMAPGGLGEWDGIYAISHNPVTDQIYVGGMTSCSDFPTTPDAYETVNAVEDAWYISTLDADLENLVASTIIPGSDGYNYAYGLTIDDDGDVYISGGTFSDDFPTIPGVSWAEEIDDGTIQGHWDAAVAKFNPTLTDLLASTFYGGNYEDEAYDIEVDDEGNVFLSGWTNGPVPTTEGSYKPSRTGNDLWGSIDGWLVKFDTDLSELISGTYLDGFSDLCPYTDENAKAIHIAPSGDIYVTGTTDCETMVVSPDAYDTTSNGYYDGFLYEFDSNLSQIHYSTYIGGDLNDNRLTTGADITIDNYDNILITGSTTVTDFPVHDGAYSDTYSGLRDGFVISEKRDQLPPVINLQTSLSSGTTVKGVTIDKYFGRYVESELDDSRYSGEGTSMGWDDDAYWEYAFTSGFTFPFFDDLHSSAYISSNGRVCFGSGSSATPGTIDDTSCGPFVAPFWADWSYNDPGDGITISNSADLVRIGWHSSYEYAVSGNEFEGGGVGQSWSGDNNAWEYTLPFTFSIYGSDYTSAWISTNGSICFGASCTDSVGSLTYTDYGPYIAPLWVDLYVYSWEGNDIYITEYADRIIVRWDCYDWNDWLLVNIEAVLYADGTIKFNYGHRDTPLPEVPVVGVSKGDGSTYTESIHNGETDIHMLDSVIFMYDPGTDSYIETVAGGTDEVYIDAEVELHSDGTVYYNYGQANDLSDAAEHPVIGVSPGDGSILGHDSYLTRTGFLVTEPTSYEWYEIDMSPIRHVQYQVGGTAGTWTDCSADDGSFDSSIEKFTCIINDVSPSSIQHTVMDPISTIGSPEPAGSYSYLLGKELSATYTVYLRSQDVQGNTSSLLSYEGTIPDTSVSLTITSVGGVTSPVGDTYSIVTPYPPITGTTDPNVLVTLTITGVSGTITGTVQADSSGDWQWQTPSPLSPGTYSVTVVAGSAPGPTETRTFSMELVDSQDDIDPVTAGLEEEVAEDADDEDEVEGLPETGGCPVIRVFDVDPEEVEEGESVTVTWSVDNAERVTIEELGGRVSRNGRAKEVVDEDTEYELVAVNDECERNATAGVTVLFGEDEEWWRVTYMWWYYLLAFLAGVSVLTRFFGFSLADLPYYYQKYRLWVLYGLGIKGKGEPWGVVYDSVTKELLSRCVVRLYREKELVDTAVTDVNGVFNFEPRGGTYQVEVSRSGYYFPSEVISGNTDGVRKNIYNGGLLEVEGEKAPVRMYVPMDAEELGGIDAWAAKISSKIVEVLVLVSPLMTVSGVILAGYYWSRDEDAIHLWILLVYLALLGLYVYGWVKERGSWGFVMDEELEPLEGVEVGLYDPVYDRLVDTRVTDEKGRFRFVVVGGEYILRPVGAGYVIAESGYEAGYVVGHDEEGEQQVTERMVVRKVREDNSKTEST